MPAPCCRQTAGRPEDLLGNHMTAACDGSPESAPLNQLDAAHDRLEDAVNLEPIAQAASTLARGLVREADQLIQKHQHPDNHSKT